MEKLDIIKETQSILPNSFKMATIISNGTRLPLFKYMETDFLSYVKPGATATILANFFNVQTADKTSVIGKRITLNDIRMIKLKEFFENNKFIKEVIQTGPKEEEFIDVRTYLTEYVLEHMDDTGLLMYVGRTITIEELFLKLLSNEYHAPTLEDKAELCFNMASYLETEILESIVDGMDISVADYITKVLPTKMDTISTVSINGKSEEISEFIQKIANHQRKLIEDNKEKAIKEKENEYNKTGDNPGLVSEIQVRLTEGRGLEITAEIPIVTSSLLSESEEESLLANYTKRESVTKDDYYICLINKLKETIGETNNSHDLNTKMNFFDQILEELGKENNSEELSEKIEPYIESLKKLIADKQKNLIKVSSNSDEYIDVLFSEINLMNDEMSNFTTLDEYSLLYGKALERYEDTLKKGIKDIQLKSEFHLLFKRINEKRLNLELTMGYQSSEVERVKIMLNELIMNIQADVLRIEHDSNNLGNLTGTSIRLESEIERAKNQVEEAYLSKLLTETDREYYFNRLKSYSIALDSEKKIGFGTR